VGDSSIEKIIFRKKEEQNPLLEFSEQGVTDHFVKPDLIIAENGIVDPQVNFDDIVETVGQETADKLGVASDGIPAANIRFSLYWNDIQSPMLACGSATYFPSFLQKVRLRVPNIKYNVEQGFYAAMNMLDKQVQFNYLHMQSLKLGDKSLYFVGEPINGFTEILTHTDEKTGKFVQYYIYGEEIVGFVTYGYKNLHLYLWEAMKQMIMPNASELKHHDCDFRPIVSRVLQMSPNITANRKITLENPSVIRAEFTRERDELQEMRVKLQHNIDNMNAKQYQKIQKLKLDQDREGVN